MSSLFPCPYLGNPVELSSEREAHIAERHPDLLPEHRSRIADTLANPDEVRHSVHLTNARLFSRWFKSVRSGKFVVVVVVSDNGAQQRHWIITAYLARRLAKGDQTWTRD